MTTAYTPRKYRIAYIGWVGEDNIGDELGPIVFRQRLFRAHPELEPDVEIVFHRSAWPSCDATVACLGTLLAPWAYGTGWMKQFERASIRGPLVGIGLGALPPGWERWPTTSSYRARCVQWFDALSVRGHRTAEALRRPESAISGDSVFGLTWAPARNGPKAIEDRPRLAVNVGEGLYPLLSGRGEPLVDIVGRLCKAFRHRFRIRLFSMGRRDDGNIRRIGAACGPDVECVYDRDPFVLAQLLRDCDLGLTTKCHASGLLYALGVPTVNIAYAPKCADLASVLSDSRFVVPIEEVTEERLTQAVDDLAADLAQATSRLAADVVRVRATWDEHFARSIAPIVDHLAGRYTNRKRAVRVAHALRAIPVYTLAVARRAHRALSPA
jgi:hypothetical protein